MIDPSGLAGEISGGELLGDHASPAMIVDADVACDDVARLFQEDPQLGCVLVRDGGRVGIVSRTPFALAMVGPLGYGRALHGGRTIRVLTDWDPVTVSADTSVERASELVLDHGREGFPPDLVVCLLDGSFAKATSGVVFAALAAGLYSTFTPRTRNVVPVCC